jgi:hypothetical protein
MVPVVAVPVPTAPPSEAERKVIVIPIAISPATADLVGGDESIALAPAARPVALITDFAALPGPGTVAPVLVLAIDIITIAKLPALKTSIAEPAVIQRALAATLITDGTADAILHVAKPLIVVAPEAVVTVNLPETLLEFTLWNALAIGHHAALVPLSRTVILTQLEEIAHLIVRWPSCLIFAPHGLSLVRHVPTGIQPSLRFKRLRLLALRLPIIQRGAALPEARRCRADVH